MNRASRRLNKVNQKNTNSLKQEEIERIKKQTTAMATQ